MRIVELVAADDAAPAAAPDPPLLEPVFARDDLRGAVFGE